MYVQKNGQKAKQEEFTNCSDQYNWLKAIHVAAAAADNGKNFWLSSLWVWKQLNYVLLLLSLSLIFSCLSWHILRITHWRHTHTNTICARLGLLSAAAAGIYKLNVPNLLLLDIIVQKDVLLVVHFHLNILLSLQSLCLICQQFRCKPSMCFFCSFNVKFFHSSSLCPSWWLKS